MSIKELQEEIKHLDSLCKLLYISFSFNILINNGLSFFFPGVSWCL